MPAARRDRITAAAVVLFATSLALAGIGARLAAFPIRAAVVGMGWAVFIGTVAWLTTFPVAT